MEPRTKTVYDTQIRTRCEPKVTYVTKEIPVFNVVARPAQPCRPNMDCGQGASGGASGGNYGASAGGGGAAAGGASSGGNWSVGGGNYGQAAFGGASTRPAASGNWSSSGSG